MGIGCNCWTLVPITLDVLLLVLILFAGVNDLRQRSLSFTFPVTAQVFVVLFATSTLVFTVWAIWRLAFNGGGDEEDGEGAASMLPLLLLVLCERLPRLNRRSRSWCNPRKPSSDAALVSPSMHDSHYLPGEHPAAFGDNPALAEGEAKLEEHIK
ncbi:hypothetical protein JCM11491_001843 [Sporobolomyces phaffii]